MCILSEAENLKRNMLIHTGDDLKHSNNLTEYFMLAFSD